LRASASGANGFRVAGHEERLRRAGDPFAGATYAETGGIVGIFVDPAAAAEPPLAGGPVGGVAITRDGVATADDDSYFSNLYADRTTVDADQDATGANGSALLVGSATPVPHSGTGGRVHPRGGARGGVRRQLPLAAGPAVLG
jgi:hypothetical protein